METPNNAPSDPAGDRVLTAPKPAPAPAGGTPPKAKTKGVTVGRTVNYHDNRRFKEAPCAAIVTQVHNDKTVNLCVFLPDGKIEPKQGVAEAPKDGPTLNTWSWPVYEKG